MITAEYYCWANGDLLLFVILSSLLLYMFEVLIFKKVKKKRKKKKWCWEEENSFPWWILALNRDMNKTTVEQRRKKKKLINFYGFISLLPAHILIAYFISLNILNLFKNCILFLITIINLIFGNLSLLFCFGDLRFQNLTCF